MSSPAAETALAIARKIAEELGVKLAQVVATVGLIDEGATVPFIARYRKEVTGGLDDTQLRNLDERLRYLREMEERREAVIKSVAEQGKLTPELEKEFREADSKARLEDLYLPYKQKRRTKAQIAREAGLEPLADALLGDPARVPAEEALKFIDAEKGVADVKAALDGARQILMERFAEDAALLARMRDFLWREATISAKVVPGKENEGVKFRDYFAHSEKLAAAPSHRVLAMLRGRNEGFLSVGLAVGDEEDRTRIHPCEDMIAGHIGWSHRARAADDFLQEVVRWTWRVKLLMHFESELIGEIREKADEEAINVFARNLKALLMAAPAGMRPTMGLDPGLRTGVKVVVVGATGELLAHLAIFPHEPRNDWDNSIAVLAALCQKHKVELIAIGNGTASRETDKLAAELLKKHPAIKAQKIVVSEAGASVYSASELAAKEFPDLDVSYRGAVSIARRLQDPLAELVKIEPKSIGVGQYQHDVNQLKLARSLDGVVEDCVNAVGVDVNTASAPLLARIAGLNSTIAGNIVAFRAKNGPFASREKLKDVPRLGERTFEQAAGFLRVTGGDNPLDASAVHPEAYPLVEAIAQKSGRELKSLIGDGSFLRSVKPQEFVSEKFGVPTISDILKELDKPGRDPRGEFRAAELREDVQDLKDLKPGMVLEGTVTNVAAFGAFVDIGVHQDGLVHVSALASKFVKDPHEVVKAGDIVKVKVMEVDIARKRIALSMRMDDQPGAKQPAGGAGEARGGRGRPDAAQQQRSFGGAPAAGGKGAFAAALQKAGVNKK
ncbi:MAG: Tex family protein [Pseudomonadota bacterium]